MNYFRIFGFATLFAGAAFAQDVISARSGLIHYTEGKVFVENELVAPKAGNFPEMKQGQVLRTEMGRAEVLFSPGVFLRVSENSSFRMLNNALENTAIELTAGSVLLEVGEVQKDQTIRVVVAGTDVEVTKAGLYRIDADPGSLRVYDGAAVVATKEEGTPVTIKEGKQTLLAGVIAPEKFNKEMGDAFHRWAGRRSGYIAMANLAATRSMGMQGTRWRTSSWLYNPYFGAFTYIPFQGRYVTPWGWAYYSPRYQPPVVAYPDSGFGGGGGMMNSGRGYGDMGGRGSMSSSGGYSGGSGSSGASSAPPAPAAAPRGADGGGSRSSQGGR